MAPGFGRAAMPAPATGHGIAMPTPSRNGSASAIVVPVAYRSLENSDDLDDDRRDARAGEQRGEPRPCVNARRNVPRSHPRPGIAIESREKSISMTSNIASARTTKSKAMATLNHGRRVDRAERARGENDDQAEHAVDHRHRAAVGRAEQEAAAPRSRLGAGADDRQVDRNHRQHARRQVEREAADEHDEEDGERRRGPRTSPSRRRRSPRCE